VTFYASTDGASKGNPGRAGIGAVIQDSTGKIVKTISASLPETTNNVAEYIALRECLKAAATLPCKRLIVRSDSQLLVYQLKGKYKIRKPHLKKLNDEIKKMIAAIPFPVEFHYICREENTAADKLANEGISQLEKILI